MVSRGDDSPFLRAPFRRYLNVKNLGGTWRILDWCHFDSETQNVGIIVSNLSNPKLAHRLPYTLQSYPLTCGMILQEGITEHVQSSRGEPTAQTVVHSENILQLHSEDSKCEFLGEAGGLYGRRAASLRLIHPTCVVKCARVTLPWLNRNRVWSFAIFSYPILV